MRNETPIQLRQYEQMCMSDRRVWPWLRGALADWSMIVAAMSASLWYVTHADHLPSRIAVFVVAMWFVGVCIHRLAMLAHDAGHRTVSRKAWLNDLLTVGLIYGPALVSLGAWRMFHNEGHHPKIHTGTLKDPEIVFKRLDQTWTLPVSRRKVAFGTVLALCGGALPGAVIFLVSMASPRCFARVTQLMRYLLAKMRRLDGDIVPLRLKNLPTDRGAVIKDLALGLATVALRFVVTASVVYAISRAIGFDEWTLALLMWYGGFVTSFWAMFRLRGYCEHVGTRTVELCEPSPLWRFFVFAHAAWAHQLHHDLPGLPFHRYKDVLRARGAKGIAAGNVFKLFETSPAMGSGEFPPAYDTANLMLRAEQLGLIEPAVAR